MNSMHCIYKVVIPSKQIVILTVRRWRLFRKSVDTEYIGYPAVPGVKDFFAWEWYRLPGLHIVGAWDSAQLTAWARYREADATAEDVCIAGERRRKAKGV